MTSSKTFRVGRSGNRSSTDWEGRKPVSGWPTLGRWVLGFVVALALSAQVDARTVKAEQAARLERRGLWVDREPTAPWDLRAAKRASQVHLP